MPLYSLEFIETSWFVKKKRKGKKQEIYIHIHIHQLTKDTVSFHI